jgi:hypothetical protein
MPGGAGHEEYGAGHFTRAPARFRLLMLQLRFAGAASAAGPQSGVPTLA